MSRLTRKAQEFVELCERTNRLGRELRRWTPRQRTTRYGGHAYAGYLADVARLDRMVVEMGRLLADDPDAAVMRPRPGHPVPEALVSAMS